MDLVILQLLRLFVFSWLCRLAYSIASRRSAGLLPASPVGLVRSVLRIVRFIGWRLLRIARWLAHRLGDW
jgi:hypothetical protein